MFDEKTFVEASPVDSIWGICLPMGTDEIDDEELAWKEPARKGDY